ncbi:MAG: nitroreductase family protein [Pseudomonadota bacterium]
MSPAPPDHHPGTALPLLDSVDLVLSTTRSVRRKLDFERAIDPQTLFECVDLATQAPMGLAGEHWRFVVLTELAIKTQLADVYRSVIDELQASRRVPIKRTQRALTDRLHELPALVVLCSTAPPPGADLSSQIGFYGSILPCAWSFMLALRARGLGTTWTSLLSARQDEVRRIIGAPESVFHLVMFPVAYTLGATLRPAQRQDARAVTYWNRYGDPPPA